MIDALKEGYSFEETPQGLGVYKTEKYPALAFHPAAKSGREMQEVARLLDLAIDYDSPRPQIYEVTKSTEGHIQPAFEHMTQAVAWYPTTQATWNQQDSMQTLPPPQDQQRRWQGRNDVVISTRSLLEVMFYLSQGISIPEEHLEQGLVTITVDE